MSQTDRLRALIQKDVSPGLTRMSRTRSHLFNDSPFFGAAASKLHLIETAEVETLRTNGTWLKFNPKYIAQLADEELAFGVAHEAMHACLRHPHRMTGKDPELANVAADYVVNGELIRGNIRGMTPPAGILHDPRFNDMGIEKVYAILDHERPAPEPQPQPEPEPDDQEEDGEDTEDSAPEPDDTEDADQEEDSEDEPADSGEDAEDSEDSAPEPEPEPDDQEEDGEDTEDSAPEPDDTEDTEDTDQEEDEPGEDDQAGPERSYSGYEPGEIEEAPAPGELTEGEGGAQVPAMTEDDWEIAALQAATIAEKLAPGTGAGGMDRAIKTAREPRVDWREMLRQFIEQTVPQDYSWQRMNPMLLADDIYQPGLTKENTPRIGVLVDTSASITERMIEEAGAELADIQSQARPDAITVIYCDTGIRGIEEFGPDEPIDLHPAGGGGTYLTPALAEFTRRVEEDGENIAALVVFTDLYTETLPDPGIPTLFIVPLWSVAADPEFGTVVRVPSEVW